MPLRPLSRVHLLAAQGAGRLAKIEEKNGAVCKPGGIQQPSSGAVLPDMEVRTYSRA